MADDQEGSDDETITPSQTNETPPSYSKGDDIVTAIQSMTAEKRESLLKLLAEKGFQNIQCQQPG